MRGVLTDGFIKWGGLCKNQYGVSPILHCFLKLLAFMYRDLKKRNKVETFYFGEEMSLPMLM